MSFSTAPQWNQTHYNIVFYLASSLPSLHRCNTANTVQWIIVFTLGQYTHDIQNCIMNFHRSWVDVSVRCLTEMASSLCISAHVCVCGCGWRLGKVRKTLTRKRTSIAGKWTTLRNVQVVEKNIIVLTWLDLYKRVRCVKGHTQYCHTARSIVYLVDFWSSLHLVNSAQCIQWNDTE